MDLAGKYDKTNLLGDGDVQVWRGRERSRGTPVLLHTFTGSPKLLLLATQYLLKQPANSPLLDIGEWEGATCLVTVSELDLLDVKAWLENAVASSPAATPAPQPPPINPRVNTTGPVTIPRADSGLVTKPDVPPSPPLVPPAAPPPLAAPQGPGEFTRAFQLPNANVPAQRPPDPVASGPVKPPPGPGEFTRAFQIPSSTVPPAPLPDPMASSGPAHVPAKTTPAGPGEFTQLFRLPGQGGQTGNQPTARPPELGLPTSPPDIHPPMLPPMLPPAAPPAAAPAGEFTRLFRTQPNPNPPGDFSGSSGSPKQNFPSPELPPVPAAPRMNIATGPVAVPHSAPPVPKGPGEYTRVMQTPSLQTPQAPPQPSASPSPASAQAVQIPISVTPPAMPSVPSMPSVPAPPALPTPQVPYVQASIPVPQAPSIQPPSFQAPSVQAPNVQIPAPAPRSGISPAILLLGGLILIAVILVLIFALRR